jgi:hypothetical protein
MAQEELPRPGWGQAELAGLRMGDPRKVMMAARLRRETKMTLSWIATRLQLGAPGHVACPLHQSNGAGGVCEIMLF